MFRVQSISWVSCTVILIAPRSGCHGGCFAGIIGISKLYQLIMNDLIDIESRVPNTCSRWGPVRRLPVLGNGLTACRTQVIKGRLRIRVQK